MSLYPTSACLSKLSTPVTHFTSYALSASIPNQFFRIDEHDSLFLFCFVSMDFVFHSLFHSLLPRSSSARCFYPPRPNVVMETSVVVIGYLTFPFPTLNVETAYCSYGPILFICHSSWQLSFLSLAFSCHSNHHTRPRHGNCDCCH